MVRTGAVSGRAIPLFAAVAVVALIVWMYFGRGVQRMGAPIGNGHSAASESPEELRGRAARVFAALPMDTECLRDVAAMRAVLDSGEVRDPEFASDPRLAELLDQSAEFLCGRYGPDANPDRYIRWRQSQGYRWTDRDHLEMNWTVHEAWPLIVPGGSPFPGYDHLDRVFVGVFDSILDLNGGRPRPVGICAVPDGLLIDRDFPTKGNPDLDLISGMMDTELWHGHSVGTLCSFWQPPRTYDQILVNDGSVEVVRIGIVVEFADGSRRPVIQKWLFDPKADRWFLYVVNEQHDEGKGSAGYF